MLTAGLGESEDLNAQAGAKPVSSSDCLDGAKP